MAWCIDKTRQPSALGKLAAMPMIGLRRMTKPPDV
jgi:hypothetical protein